MGPKPSVYKPDPEHASKLSILFLCHRALLGHNLNSSELEFSLTTRNIDWDPAFKNSEVNEPLSSITNSQAFVIWVAFNIKISYVKKRTRYLSKLCFWDGGISLVRVLSKAAHRSNLPERWQMEVSVLFASGKRRIQPQLLHTTLISKPIGSWLLWMPPWKVLMSSQARWGSYGKSPGFVGWGRVSRFK